SRVTRCHYQHWAAWPVSGVRQRVDGALVILRPAASQAKRERFFPFAAVKLCLHVFVLWTKMVETVSSSLMPVPKSPPSRTLSPSAAKLKLLKKLRCTLRYEKKAWATGAQLVAGVDEVGRGSLFGC